MTGPKNDAPGESFVATPAAPENPDPPTHGAAVRDPAFAHLRRNILRIRIVSEKPDISFGCVSLRNAWYTSSKKVPIDLLRGFPFTLP